MKKPAFIQVPTETLRQWAKLRAFSEKERVLFAVIIKTWGWRKTSDWLSLSQIAEITAISQPNVSRALKKLVADGVIGRTGNKYRRQIIHLDNPTYPNRQSSLSKRIDTIDTRSKDSFTDTEGHFKKMKKWLGEHHIREPEKYLNALRQKCGDEKPIIKAWKDLCAGRCQPVPSSFYEFALYHAGRSQKPLP